MDQALRLRRAQLDDARARFCDEGAPGDVVASDVRRSWDRCSSDFATLPRVAPVDTDSLQEAWSVSLIRRAGAGVVAELGKVAVDLDFVAAVTDADGRILWSSGGASMRRAATKANFVDGGRWDERRAGTNAPGLALVTGRPASVFAAEHWCESVREWVCYAAPVRDQAGEVVGVIDLSSSWQRANPLAMTTVTTLARLLEHEIALQAPPSFAARLRVLGPPSLTTNGVPVALTPRQLEMLTVLASRPATLDELQALVYGDRMVSVATVKAEISHLRRLLGGGIASRPYRLTVDVQTDYLDLLQALRMGDVVTATRLYRGQLLPLSESPFVVDERHHIDVALRDALLRWGAVEDLVHYTTVHPWDVELLERAQALASPRELPEIRARLARVTREDALSF